jgi:rare lipoprotein A (peptidoglycan hydrolase)
MRPLSAVRTRHAGAALGALAVISPVAATAAASRQAEAPATPTDALSLVTTHGDHRHSASAHRRHHRKHHRHHRAHKAHLARAASAPAPAFRAAFVSWYGPGLYGNPTACGGTLTPGTLGVANKTLPCGTMVTIRNGAATVRVPVIDRGPYVAGREFDLTSATRDALGFSGVGTVQVAIG